MTVLQQTMDNMGVGTCELAGRTMISPSNISGYRKGYARPNYKTAQRIALALSVDVADLWPEPLSGQPEDEQCR